jgi:hypothetical protein
MVILYIHLICWPMKSAFYERQQGDVAVSLALEPEWRMSLMGAPRL